MYFDFLFTYYFTLNRFYLEQFFGLLYVQLTRIILIQIFQYFYSTDHNDPPKAVAGKDQVVYLPSRTISIDGSKSYDDGLIDAFKWIRTGLSPAAGVNIPLLSFFKFLVNLDRVELVFSLNLFFLSLLFIGSLPYLEINFVKILT